MNDERKERIARNLCKIRGIDPDAMIGHEAPPNAQGFVPAVYMQSPAWTRILIEVDEHIQIHDAIAIKD